MSQTSLDFVPVVIGAPPDAKPPGWEWVELLDVAELESGHTPRKSVPEYWENGDIPWLSLRDIRAAHGKTTCETGLSATSLGIDNSSARVLPAGTVCFSRDISVGFVTIMGREMATSQHFANWICEEALDNRFLMFAFMASRDRLIHSGEGTTVRTIYMPALKQLQICVPPLAEQRRIVSTIESFNEQASRATRALSEVGPLLEQFRKSVLRAALSGHLTAEWRAAHRDVEPATELLSRIGTQRRHHWEHAELAKYEANGKKPPQNWRDKYKEPEPVNASVEELPDGWCWCRMKDVGDVQLGRQRSPKYHSGPNMRPYLRVMNVFEDRIDTGDVMEMDFSPEDFERYRLEDGDILLNEGQSRELVGRPAIYRGEVPGSCFTNTLVRFRPDAPLTADYPLIVFLAYLKIGRFQRVASLTVNIAHLGAGRFADMAFPLPPLDEQAEIVRQARSALDQIKEMERFVAESESALKQLDQSILAKAFRGELVPQDARDDPIRTSIVNVIKTREERASKPPTRKSPVTKTAPASDQLVSWLAKTKRKSFSFDDLRADIRVNYDELRDAIFDLLTDKKSGFEQYFDEAERAMRFRKAAK